MLDHDDAEAMLAELQRENSCGLRFIRLIGHGKSAAVFEALDDHGNRIAAKVYAPFLAARSGFEVQRARIERELSLKGHLCPSLVKIVGGGEITYSGKQTFFVSMEYLDGVSLAEQIRNRGPFPDHEIRLHLRSLYEAANWLLSRGLCHRDIKSANCHVLLSGSLILLDLGVLRPIKGSDLTDAPDDLGSRQFVSTQRYAPPELLLRREADNFESWVAITIYQIGAVVYEMLEGRQLFHDIHEPPAALMEAVLLRTPLLAVNAASQDLVSFARRCLIKDPSERVKAVDWSTLPEL